LALVAVGASSFFATLYLPVGEVLRTITALPFVAALFAALFQIVRDHSSFENDRLKQEREHSFTVAATSHMSTVVFNKHVEFCEAYLKALQDLLGILLAEGPKKKAREHLQPLNELRRTYRLWISPSVAGKLDEFESKVARMAGSLGLWEAGRGTKNYEAGDDKHLDKAYELFSEIMNMDKDKRDDADAESKKIHGYALVIEHLQGILGIETLTELRDTVLRNATNRK
jgi:hypothetical protein